MELEIERLPARLGRYDVRGKIGEGGMAVVYLGRSRAAEVPRERRLVALKAIKSAYTMNTEYLTMFADEAKIVERLDHPSIVQVYELAAEGMRMFMAMEYLDGQSLRDLWSACRDRGVRMRYDILAYVAARVAEGLHHAHELRDEHGEWLQLVHRDVNPANIFLTYDGRVKVIDFGLAFANAKFRPKTRAGVVKGKLGYLAPEQAAGLPVDRRTDVFALAVTLWELSTDQRLFRVEGDGETIERVLACVVPDPRTLVEGYPDELWEIIRRGLAKDPAHRYATTADMALALDAFLRKQPEPVTPQMLADILDALFAEQKTVSAAWLEQADRGDEPAQATTLRPRAPDSDAPEPRFDLPLGDFAPPSLSALPHFEDPLGITGSGAYVLPAVTPVEPSPPPPSSSVPFELIGPSTAPLATASNRSAEDEADPPLPLVMRAEPEPPPRRLPLLWIGLGVVAVVLWLLSMRA